MGQDLTSAVKTVGWKERVRIIGPRQFSVVAKIDSGASTSSLHVHRFSFLKGRDSHGREMLRFEVVAREENGEQEKYWFEAPFVRFADVRPSTSEAQRRPVVVLTVEIAGECFEMECNLVCRAGMRCRMLLGRGALAGRYLVDCSQVYLLTKREKRSPKTT